MIEGLMMARLWPLVILGFGLSGCGVGEGTSDIPPWESPPAGTPGKSSPAPPDLDSLPPYDPTFDGEESYRVKMETTKGDVVIAVVSAWAPLGAARFRELVEAGFYDDTRIFHVDPKYVVQFGLSGDPDLARQWSKRKIGDDRPKRPNERGYVTFAMSGAHSRISQVFINLADNPDFDFQSESFAPFGKVVEGIEVVHSLNSEYGDVPITKHREVAQSGNAYFDRHFPNLDRIKKMSVLASPHADEPENTDPSTDETGSSSDARSDRDVSVPG